MRGRAFAMEAGGFVRLIQHKAFGSSEAAVRQGVKRLREHGGNAGGRECVTGRKERLRGRAGLTVYTRTVDDSIDSINRRGGRFMRAGDLWQIH